MSQAKTQPAQPRRPMPHRLSETTCISGWTSDNQFEVRAHKGRKALRKNIKRRGSLGGDGGVCQFLLARWSDGKSLDMHAPFTERSHFARDESVRSSGILARQITNATRHRSDSAPLIQCHN